MIRFQIKKIANKKSRSPETWVIVPEDLAVVGGEVIFVVAAVIAAVSKTIDDTASTLVFIWKPPATMARAPPRVSPVGVTVIAAMPVAAPAVVRTIEVLVAVAAGVEVLAVKDATVLAMEATDPKK